MNLEITKFNILQYVNVIVAVNAGVGSLKTGWKREERLIGWNKTRVNQVVVNTEGASKGNPGLASASGVLRNGSGQWLYGFAANIRSGLRCK